MPKPLDPKCQLCAKLPTSKAKVLHGDRGDGCWNPKVCHNRRSFYRRRTDDNSAQLDAIANYLAQVKDEISLTKLQQGLKMPMVEVWLGLLLGGFTLEQRGDFYNSRNIWVITC